MFGILAISLVVLGAPTTIGAGMGQSIAQQSRPAQDVESRPDFVMNLIILDKRGDSYCDPQVIKYSLEQVCERVIGNYKKFPRVVIQLQYFPSLPVAQANAVALRLRKKIVSADPLAQIDLIITVIEAYDVEEVSPQEPCDAKPMRK